jgi:hypothetical protein
VTDVVTSCIRKDDRVRPGIRLALALSLLLASASVPCRADAGTAVAKATEPMAPASGDAPGRSPGLSLESAAAEFETAFPFDFSIDVYQTGWSKFEKGDRIVIRAVRGNRAKVEVGGLYAVMGAYTLASMDTAVLGLFVTTAEGVGKTPIFRHQMHKVPKGSGTFLLWYTMTVDGAPHVSFYPVSRGSEARGGVYFQGTSFHRQFPAGSANTPAAADPVFKYYLPPSGNVRIGQPIFKNFIDSQAPQ